MGLKEKRAQKEFIDNVFPGLEQELHTAVKFAVEIEVEWDKLSEDGSGHLYNECWPDVYFKPAIEAFNAITSDDMGAEALKESLKRIIITNEAGISLGSQWSEFSDGVLKLDHKPHTNVTGSSYHDRIKHLQKNLEDNL